MPGLRYILGISAYYHDAAAALLRDGQIVAAAQEERFTRKKNDPDFPRHAVQSCLEQGGITTEQLAAVAFYDKPILKFTRMLETYLAVAPGGWRTFPAVLPSWLGEKLNLRRTIREELPGLSPKCQLLFTEHHQSHAASAFYPSPFERAAILTIDGVGEWATTTIGQGSGRELRLFKELRFPHSLGLLYSAFTDYCGFRINSGEYKLMGLAPYGEPRYVEAIYSNLLDLKPDGSFWLNLEYFDFLRGTTMANRRFHALFGGPPRRPETPVAPRYMDVARSAQVVTEEIMLRLARHAREVTGEKHLCLAGGVALNCVANGLILKERIFERLWIQPAAGDAGGALGAALCAWHLHGGAQLGTVATESHSLATTDIAVPPPEESIPSPPLEERVRERIPRNELSRFEPLNPNLRKYLIIKDGILRFLGRVRERRHFRSEVPCPNNNPCAPKTDTMQGSLLGPSYSDEQIEAVLKREGAAYRRLDRETLLDATVDLLKAEKVVGWFQGRMEFGPRALGNRSILGDARSPRMQSVMNLKVKFRESFRPFAPVVRRERVSEYFDLDVESPYMLLVAPIRPELRRPLPAGVTGLDLLKAVRSTIPAVTHVDYSARIQTVQRAENPLLYDLLLRFEAATGCGVLVNTSFNVRGEPIVCTPADAYRCFVNTEMDYLVMGSFVLERTAQPRQHAPRTVPLQPD